MSENINMVDALHKIIYNQNQQIAELKKQLEKKNQHITELQKQLEEKERLLQYGKTEIKKLHKRINDIVKRDEKLFKSQPTEIVEKIRDLAGDYFYETGKEDLLLTGSDFTEILDTILKEYQ